MDGEQPFCDMGALQGGSLNTTNRLPVGNLTLTLFGDTDDLSHLVLDIFKKVHQLLDVVTSIDSLKHLSVGVKSASKLTDGSTLCSLIH